MIRTEGRGFTLVEVLVGLAITAMLVAVLFAALRLGSRAQEKGSERVVLAQRMRIVADRLTVLIRGAYPFHYKKEGDETKNILLFRAGKDSLEFVTASVDPWSGSPADRMGMKTVKLFVDSSGLKARERMYMSEPEEDDAEGEEFVIDPAVTGIGFEYLRVDPEDREESWEDAWDEEDDDFLPSAIRVKVRIRHKGVVEEMPEIVAVVRTGFGAGRRVPEEFRTNAALAGEGPTGSGGADLPEGHPDVSGVREVN